MNSRCRPAVGSWGLFRALVLLIGSAACSCTLPAVPPVAVPPARGEPCKNIEAAIRVAGVPTCTVAERVCLLVSDVPIAIATAEFLPESSYAARFRVHVSVWRRELDELAKEPSLETYVHVTQRKLELLDHSESDRRLIVENGDLLHALRVLREKAAGALASSGLGCSL